MHHPLFKVHMPDNAHGALAETLSSGFVAEGDKVSAFADRLADFLGNPHVVPTSSCTMALQIAYRLCDIGPGDNVISTPLTCVASNIPLLYLGAEIRWADCDPDTGMIDPEEIPRLADDRTKAVLVLHKEGDLARMDEINTHAAHLGIKVVEDAAHAIGAEYQGTKVGSTADFACFSFQAIKHITTGDGGLLACRSDNDRQRARALKWFGINRELRTSGSNAWLEDIPEPGYKGNMNDIAATIGLAQMPYLPGILDAHNRNGREYSRLLSDTPGIQLVPRRPNDFETYWAYSLQAENRNGLARKLEESGIASGQIHIRNDNYSMFSKSTRPLPRTDAYVERELCIPCGWWMTAEDIDNVCRVIKGGW